MKRWISLVLTALMVLGMGLVTAQADESFVADVEVIIPQGDTQAYFDEYVIPKFNEEYPNIKVTCTQMEGDKLNARLAAGDIPAMTLGVFGYEPALYAKQGKIAPLDDLDGAQEIFDRLDPVFLHKDFGNYYYVPMNANTQLMIYNRELFEEAGLDPDAPPTTMEEFLEYAKKISELPNRENGDQVYGTIFWNDALNWGGWYWTMLSQIYNNFNDGQYQLFNTLGTDVVFDKPEAKMTEFLTFLKEAQQYAPPTMEKNFFHRNVGMWLQFGYGWKNNLKEAKDTPMEIGVDVAIAPLPTNGDTSWSTLDGRSLMIFKTNPEREAATWELIKFLMRDDINLEGCKMLNQLPTLAALKDDPFFEAPDNKPFVDQLANTLPNEPVAELNDVSNVIQQKIIAVAIDGTMSPEDAVTEAAAEARELLKGGQQ